MDDRFWIAVGSQNEQKGPYTFAQLQSMWRSGVITADTLYTQEGFEEWIPLASMEELLNPPPARTVPRQVERASTPVQIGLKPHRANLILTFALVGLFLGPFALAAWVMGSSDLQEMKSCVMDRSGEATTHTGRNIGMIASALWIIVLGIYMLSPD